MRARRALYITSSHISPMDELPQILNGAMCIITQRPLYLQDGFNISDGEKAERFIFV